LISDNKIPKNLHRVPLSSKCAFSCLFKKGGVTVKKGTKSRGEQVEQLNTNQVTSGKDQTITETHGTTQQHPCAIQDRTNM